MFPRLSLLDLHGLAVSAVAAEGLLRSCPMLECLRVDFGAGAVRGLAAVLDVSTLCTSLGKVQFRGVDGVSSRDRRASTALALLDDLEEKHPRIDWERWPGGWKSAAPLAAAATTGLGNGAAAAPAPSLPRMEQALRSLKRKMRK